MFHGAPKYSTGTLKCPTEPLNIPRRPSNVARRPKIVHEDPQMLHGDPQVKTSTERGNMPHPRRTSSPLLNEKGQIFNGKG